MAQLIKSHTKRSHHVPEDERLDPAVLEANRAEMLALQAQERQARLDDLEASRAKWEAMRRAGTLKRL